jgi:hypothetical protein
MSMAVPTRAALADPTTSDLNVIVSQAVRLKAATSATPAPTARRVRLRRGGESSNMM